ncbi:DUF6600 domain-containing protein [Sorangium sp. So ce590]|uniref:DUF6600 domain-containing protein n=1 Tax=Sorangium sp. So ce590 TaxID=3133317 RepID=UPI003F5D9BA9
MHPMPLPPSAPPTRPAPAASGIFRARLRRLGGALPLLATLIVALIAAPSSAAAQGLPQGYTTDEPAAAGETAPSQPVETQPVQAEVGVSAEIAVDAYEDADPSVLVEFQEPLAPYGTWLDDPSYGRVWVPSAVVVGPDFAPYQTAGRWELTDDGEWMWVSDYAWGHIPFHYGRWVWISAHGWSWIPGRVYAPAWVVWRVGDYGYVGWAPMPPTYYWSSGVALSLWTVPPAAYVFCPTTHVFHHHVHRHVVRDREIVRRIAAHSHTYRPARPTMSRTGRDDVRPDGRRGAGRSSPSHGIRPGSYRPASPSLAEAGVPSSSAPRHRAKADPRALAYARKSAAPSARPAPSPSRRPLLAPSSPAGDRRAAPSLRTPRAHDGGAPAPVARPGFRPRGSSDGAALPRAGASAPHRGSRATVAPPSPAPAPAPRGVPAPRVHTAPPAPRVHTAPPAPRVHTTPPAPRVHTAPSTPRVHTAPPAQRPQVIPAPQLSAPAAKPHAVPSAPSSPRPRIHIPSGPAPGKAAPAPSRPRSR